ncbi:MAG: alpha-galactosidase [Bacteroidota bacterium]|nr:alpha-galactosidase [Bacteroidota bacterium]
MHFRFLFLFLTAFLPVYMHAQKLPVWGNTNTVQPETDWLLHTSEQKAGIYQSADGKDIILSNGLLKRVFRISPNLACIDFQNLITGQQLLRAVKPEARVTIDGKDWQIGGLYGQKEQAYLKYEWIDGLHAQDADFQYAGYGIETLSQPVHGEPRTWTLNKKQPSGKQINFLFRSKQTALQGIEITIQYALYDGLPLLVKSLQIENKGTHTIQLNRVVSEILAAVEEESAVVGASDKEERKDPTKPAAGMQVPQGLYIETNYAFNNAMRYPLSDQTTHWKTDSSYTSQVNYDYKTPCLLEIYPVQGPGIQLKPGEKFQSVRSHELLMDSYDRERRGLAIRKMYRTIAPWVTANPIFMHLVSKSDEEVRNAIDQCVATGYEAVILSFGSHINMEDSSEQNLKRWKMLAEYAHRKGILIGGYSLFSSRRISDSDDVISPVTGKPGGAFFGNAPCFGSRWGLGYRDKIKLFFTRTGFDIWENDGPYPGDVCASTTHPGHKGLEDSQWKQMEIQKELYHWLNARGVYINAPDWYFLDGTNKTGIGYREVNFSLPREDQKILNRQNIYDGTWNMAPSMGWGFVPLTRYQGGGPEAILEPLKEHIADYRQLMMQYYGAGVQACYRGPRLYDSEPTRAMVAEVISWYKKYREILNSDIIHLRRADGRDWDGILHVNPDLPVKGLAMLYNPLDKPITRNIRLPLYYTGLSQQVTISEKGVHPVLKKLDRDHSVQFTLTIPAASYTWLELR